MCSLEEMRSCTQSNLVLGMGFSWSISTRKKDCVTFLSRHLNSHCMCLSVSYFCYYHKNTTFWEKLFLWIYFKINHNSKKKKNARVDTNEKQHQMNTLSYPQKRQNYRCKPWIFGKIQLAQGTYIFYVPYLKKRLSCLNQIIKWLLFREHQVW